jgi:Tfp pilus assembly protein PilP
MRTVRNKKGKVSHKIRKGQYLGDVPTDGRVIKILPLVEENVVLYTSGVGPLLMMMK